jgi:intracellular sulfur oxidation DsrE/DsrF family protein
MKKALAWTLTLLVTTCLWAQNTNPEPIFPIVQGFGGIFDAPHATEKPDPALEYKVVIDVATGDDNKSEPFMSLINIARLMNLHAMGGVSEQNMQVVAVLHKDALWAVLNQEAYREKFGVDNPHIPLFQELKRHGVKLLVCSQSLFKREVPYQLVTPEVEVATSMLTTMTTYQLKGYAALKF